MATVAAINDGADNATSGGVTANLNLTLAPPFVVATPYPSGFSQTRITVTAVLVTPLMVFIVVGNVMVVVAIAREKSLKLVQNWFLASLAVADLLVGLTIMPFSLAQELMGYWHFGSLWCELWLALDVLFSTASILNLCVISLDRYWSVTQAMRYIRKRTPFRAKLMIGTAWIVSAIICLPPLMGWKDPMPDGYFPMCMVSGRLDYVIYSSMGSFWIPSVVMLIVYARVYVAARRRARRALRRRDTTRHVCDDVETTTFVSTAVPSTTVTHVQQTSPCGDDLSQKNDNSDSFADSTDDARASQRRKPADDGERTPLGDARRNGSVQTTDAEPKTVTFADRGDVVQNNRRFECVTPPADNDVSSEEPRKASSVIVRCKSPWITSLTHSSGRASLAASQNGGTVTQLKRDADRHKKRLARAREKRATLVVGVVIAAFMVCWTPFFTVYVLDALTERFHLTPLEFSIIFFLGYCNSALNPIIYTVFNQDFRKAFRKMITCKT
ncbi:PREDICTED: 5-hydroxytryptamine receptor 1D-like [Priapulus caudatus]|uniref:5-hydroxytryptamine receptor 1D-like n=1 Tax=Priapulus caudatus TaxID=37621 RepID=A0ABM1F8P5_PRICU|nr:PREDICTED: 5-hydroxytryptamine receptor 1D-like [Priapulus caudatus]